MVETKPTDITDLGVRNAATKVIIIGAGPAGLLAAQALQMKGYNVTVYEQDAGIDARPRDWNFGVYWAQGHLQECLPKDLIEEVKNTQVDEYVAGSDETMPMYNGLTEDVLKKIPTPFVMRLARKRFLRLISRGIKIEYGKRLIEVSSDGKSATGYFEDGSVVTGDLLIGADSAHSVVRNFLVGSDRARLKDCPLVASMTLAKLSTEAAVKFKLLARRQMVTLHPAVHSAYGDSKPGDWTFMIIMSWIPPDPEYDPAHMKDEIILDDLKSRAEMFGENIKCMLQSIPEGTKCWHNRLSHWIPEVEGWDNRDGTVTMIGDATHPMTFHRGQGLNNAVQDVATLVRELQENKTTLEAVNAYEKLMIPRAREAVMSSYDNSMAIHDWDKLLQSVLMTAGVQQK